MPADEVTDKLSRFKSFYFHKSATLFNIIKSNDFYDTIPVQIAVVGVIGTSTINYVCWGYKHTNVYQDYICHSYGGAIKFFQCNNGTWHEYNIDTSTVS